MYCILVVVAKLEFLMKIPLVRKPNGEGEPSVTGYVEPGDLSPINPTEAFNAAVINERTRDGRRVSAEDLKKTRIR